jgi:hypothetical protein
MDEQTFIADRVASFIIGVAIIATVVTLFIDWRVSVILVLLIFQQFEFKMKLRKSRSSRNFFL